MSALLKTHGSFRSVTIVAKNGVYYSVERRIGNEYVTEWEDTVFFAKDGKHRPGGFAFLQASREQERRMLKAQRQAIELADYDEIAKGIDG